MGKKKETKALSEEDVATLHAAKADLDAKMAVDRLRTSRQSPEERSNFVGIVLFSWVTPLFTWASRKRKKYKQELADEDLWDLPAIDNTETISDKFAEVWTEKTNQMNGELLTSKEAASLLISGIWTVVGRRMKVAGLLKFFNSTVQFSYPFLIQAMIQFVAEVASGQSVELWHGYAFAAAYGFAMVLKALTENNYFFLSMRSGWQTRSIVSTEVYRKSLRLSSSARQSKTLGEIVNLMQLDSTKLEQFLGMAFHVLWDGIYQIVAYLVILYTLIGWSTFVGLAVMVVAVPIQILVFKSILGINRKMVKVTDSRVKLTNEILQGIQSIKMAGWEYSYSEMIGELRKKEIKYLRSQAYLSAFSIAFMTALPTVTAAAALSVFAIQRDGDIDAATLFAAITAFNQLRFPLMFYPNALNQLAAAKISLGRIADFFALDEVNKDATDSAATESEVVVRITDSDFLWAKTQQENKDTEKNKKESKKKGRSGKARKQESNDAESGSIESQMTGRVALQNIDISIRKNELCAIVGSVGSGKSSLVNAILGEMHSQRGKTVVTGSVAYAAQSAWILNATIRENIIFGEEYNESRYIRVIKACQLLHDFEILSDGDQTMIGERGINLSGGQKQRISVARAAYSSKEIVILDDPLSALDPEVARKMFETCIISFLKDRTRILVTNQLNFLSQCDQVIVIDAPSGEPGQIVEKGTYNELVNSGLDFSELMAKFNGEESKGPTTEEVIDIEKDDEEDVEGAGMTRQGSSQSMRASSSMADQGTKAKLQANEGKSLMQVEERQTGAVQADEYIAYIKSGGGYCFAGLVFLAFVLNQSAQVGNNYWVTFWTQDAEQSYLNNSFQFYIAGYAVSALLVATIAYIRGLSVFILGLNASKKLHQGLFANVLHAPMSFFDTTPIGRITSRFSKDLFLIDTQVPQFFSFFLFTVLFVIFSIGSIAFATPIFLAAVPFLAIIYFRFLQYFRPVARDTKRLESISRSPVYAHFSETLGGLATIRAYDRSKTFMHTNAGKVDHNLRSWYSVKAIERWLALRLEALGGVISLLAASLVIYSASEGNLDAGTAGFSLSFTIGLTGLLNQTVRMFAELEAGMNSVERVIHYTKNIEQEAPYESAKPPPKDWPSQGTIEISNLRMRYRHDTPLVLKGMSVTIAGGMRVGVVGRTGSGKSTLLLCLLRLVEPEQNESGDGPIKIDGVDISKIGLHELRSKVSIVPQSPVMFSGTIRSNLDPFHRYDEEQLWKALAEVEMQTPVQEAGGLDGEVAEYGENFSQGQRQLLCMARSILAQAKVLLLDEATSSVDYTTDGLIQNTIRSSFADATICTIAHRLNTVIDSDRILVLDKGLVAEFDAPKNLLEDNTSVFASMVNELGPSMAAQLKTIANEAPQRF